MLHPRVHGRSYLLLSAFKDEPKPGEFPLYESLKLTIGRTLPYWNDVIVPEIKEGKKILVSLRDFKPYPGHSCKVNRLQIAAHGNSLRGIVKHLDGISDEQIMKLNLPTGTWPP